MLWNTNTFRQSEEESWDVAAGKDTWSWPPLQRCTQTVPSEDFWRREAEYQSHISISVIFGDSNENREEVPQPQRRRDEERPQKTQHPNQRGNRGLETRGGGEPASSSKRSAVAGQGQQTVSSGWKAAIPREKRNSYYSTGDQRGGCYAVWDEPMKVEFTAPWIYSCNAFQPWHLTVSS